MLALISVSNKHGVVDFAEGLVRLGFTLLSTGGTARELRGAGLSVTDVSEHTGSPEVMDGRVKTLHPRIHGGILMRDRDDDRGALEALGGKPIDVVAVNLYPFEDTVARGAAHDEVVEHIDIGGPSMVRSAAKNHGRVTVVVNPQDYDEVLRALGSADVTELAALRASLAAKAFAHTAAYDGAIAGYLSSDAVLTPGGADHPFPETLTLQFQRRQLCRYGENPHQRGACYVERGARAGSLARAKSVDGGGKEVSFNNFVDLDAALEAVWEFEGPAAVVVKHANPCGVAVNSSLEGAFRHARQADALSAFGGIVALNREVDGPTAQAMTESFLEAVVAPRFSADALDMLRQRKNLRLLETGEWLPANHGALQFKRISGGLVVHDRDATVDEVRGAQVVSQRAPTEEEWTALDFSWRVCKHVKSNAIVLGLTDRTVGIGAGQMSRVVSVRIAVDKAGDMSRGAVMASDAFFPFADGVEAAAGAGVTAVCQPGGSKRDQEVVDACDRAGMAMLFTHTRHFRH